MKYPILVVKNNLKKKYDFKKGLQWFKDNTPLEVTIEEISTSFPLTSELEGNGIYQGVSVNDKIKLELQKLIPENKYKCVVFLYGDKLGGIKTSVAEEPLYSDTDFVEVIRLDDGGRMFNHELLHTFFFSLKRKGIVIDDPMDRVFVNGKWEEYYNDSSLTMNPSNRTIALERLSPYWALIASKVPSTAPLPKKWKYFTNEEVKGLKNELIEKLDKARELAGIPFVLNSTLRDPAKNESVGGVQNSAHIKGEAVDIRCRNGSERWKIVTTLLKVGFERIGIGQTFVHADISVELPHPVIFDYYK